MGNLSNADFKNDVKNIFHYPNGINIISFNNNIYYFSLFHLCSIKEIEYLNFNSLLQIGIS